MRLKRGRMDKELISVIVPVYNTEKYLDACVESIVKQTYENIEILLLDDGSTDSSKEKCDSWAARDSRIRVIHKQNEGLAETRNRGLQEAKGKYIAWVDSDDYVSEKYLSALYEQLKEKQADISMCSFYEVFGSEVKFTVADKIVNNTYTAEEFLEKIYTVGVFSVMWNKLAEKQTYRDVIFPKGRRFEDTAVMRVLAGNCSKITVCDKPLYYYRRHDESITLVKKSPEETAAYLQEYCLLLEEDIEAYQEEDNRNLLFYAKKRFCNAVIEYYPELKKSDKKSFKKKYNMHVKVILKDSNCAMKVKMKYFMSYINIGFYLQLRKISKL